QHLLQALDARQPSATHLRIDLGDVEDVDDAVGGKERALAAESTAVLIRIAGDNLRRVLGEHLQAFEDVLRCLRCEVPNELFVYGEVRRQHEEILRAPGFV